MENVKTLLNKNTYALHIIDKEIKTYNNNTYNKGRNESHSDNTIYINNIITKVITLITKAE